MLKRRHVEEIDFCESCGQPETSMHAIFHCTWARSFWDEIKILTGIKIPKLHPQSWTLDLVDGTKVSQADACVICCGAWAIWTERNTRRHGEAGRTIAQSVKWVTDTVMDLVMAGKENLVKAPKVKAKWSPPENGVIKVNVDASFDENTNQGSSGLVIRDSFGNLLRAQALWYEFAASSMAMEAEAIRDGVQVALERGFRRVVVESDAQAIIKLWETEDFDRAEIVGVLHEIKELSAQFESFRLIFVRRDANEAAHLCAEQATNVRRRCLWLNCVPVFLTNTLYHDCMPD